MILGLMLHGAKSGGDVIAQAEKWSPYFSITRSQVYREMPAMAQEGLLKLTQILDRGRTEYAINIVGRKAFKDWYHEAPVSLDPVRNTMALKVALGGQADNGAIEAMLKAYRKMHNDEVIRLTAIADEAHDAGMDFDTSALEWIIKYHKMNLSWIARELSVI